MSTDRRHAHDFLQRLLAARRPDELVEQLAPHTDPAPTRVPGGSVIS